MFSALTAAFSVLVVASGDNPFEVVAEWVTMEYEWSNPAAREAAITSKQFIPENNAMTGLKVCGPAVSKRCTKEMVFPTVPRWRPGVPSSLSLLVQDEHGQPVLRPWPSWEANDPTDCSKIQYVQSMEIDPDGVMWTIDVGRKYFAAADPADIDNSCPPKIVFIDVPTGKILDTYIFPNDVCPHDGCFLNDLALDVPRQLAYISDTANNASDPGGVIVYDRRNRRSRRFQDSTTIAEFPVDGTIVIQNIDYSARVGEFPTDGIALDPSREHVFYQPLGSKSLHSVAASVLRNFDASMADISASVIEYEPKPDGPDGMTFSNKGELFYGGLTKNGLYKMSPNNEHELAIQDDKELRWIDTFAWDNLGYLWLTSNKLEQYFFGELDHTGADGPNFRIIKTFVDAKSYMASEKSAKRQCKPATWSEPNSR